MWQRTNTQLTSSLEKLDRCQKPSHKINLKICTLHFDYLLTFTFIQNINQTNKVCNKIQGALTYKGRMNK
jgi:flagellar biosynthesis regulator FlaF